MKKFFLTVFACLTIMATSANAAILKDAEGFSYIINYNYLIFTAGNKICSAYDISSIHILADNNQRFEFNVIDLSIRLGDETVLLRRTSNIREDYNTGKIYTDGQLLGNYKTWGKTQREIYNKLKSAALSK